MAEPADRSPRTQWDASVSGEHEDAVQTQVIDLLYQSLPQSMLSLMLSAITVIMVMWSRIDHSLLLAWLGAAIAMVAARYALAAAYQRRRSAPAEAARWGGYFTATTLAVGLLWAMAVMLFFVPESTPHAVFLVTIIIATTVGSLLVYMYWLPAFYAFGMPTIGAIALRLAIQGGFEYYSLAALILALLAVLTRIGHAGRRSMIELMRLRFANLDLVGQLRGQTQVAEEANIAKSRFLAAASHDLRQPLHALNLFASALDGYVTQPEARGLVVNINRSLASLDELFHALLDISRLDAGIVRANIVDFRLHDLAEPLAAEYGAAARAKGLAWNMRVPADLVVRSDRTLLDTMLRNLLSNALRYTSFGEVDMAVELAGMHVRIAVRDTGIGIATENQREIFDEFHQLNNPERDRTKGLGLGLAIVRRLATLLGHELTVDSAPGHGSVFALVVPVGGADGVKVAVEAVPVFDGNGTCVLVIDDEAAIREGMQVLLEQWGYRVVTAASVDEALIRLRAAGLAPEAILADYRLRAGETGAAAIDRLRTVLAREVPALLITGDTAPERLRAARASGHLLLHKPVSPARLRSALRRLLRQYPDPGGDGEGS